MAFSYDTFDEILITLDRALEKFEILGLRPKGTRFAQLRAKLAQIQIEFKSFPKQALAERWSNNDTYYALSDARAFGNIASQIATLPSNLIPRSKLKTILEGPLDPLDEDPASANVNGRNFFAELELAADLAAKGLILRGFDDVQFDYKSATIHIECKRLHSVKSVSSNVAGAAGQLSRKMAADRDRGIVALVIDRVLGVDRKVLGIRGDGQVEKANVELVSHFIDTYRDALQPPVDTRIIGVAFISRFLVYDELRNMMGSSYGFAIQPYVGQTLLEYQDRKTLEELVAYLNSRGRI